MSTAAVQAPLSEPKTLTVLQSQSPRIKSKPGFAEDYPFTVIGIFIAICLGFSITFVAALAMWIYALRDSGIMAVKF
jgi:hypothetical protein